MMFIKRLFYPTLLLILITPYIATAESSKQLAPIIVSAKAPVSANEFGGSATVVTAEEIRNSGATSVKEVLEDIPGIQMVPSGSNSSDAPQIRGQDAERVLVLVNGKRLPNTDRNLPFGPALRFNWVPVANIERIEVIRGPASSLYGADAMAGVINIITRKADVEWGGHISLNNKSTDSGVNGGDSKGISLSAAGPVGENVDLNIAVESTKQDEIFDDSNILTYQSEKNYRNFQTELGIDFNENNRLEIGAIYGKEDGEDFDRGFRGISNTEIDVVRRRGTLDYITQIGLFDANFGIMSSSADVQEGTSVWDIIENGGNIDFQGQASDKHYISFGVNYREEEADRRDTVVFNDKVDATTLFLQDVVTINDSNSLTLGLAYDMHSKYDNEASPKISWVTKLSPTLSFKAGYGESYLAPSLREGSAAYVVPAGPTRQYIGNDNLQPETSKTVELGLIVENNHNKGAITLFRTLVDDLITTTDTVNGFVTTAEYNNVDEALLQGIETEWSTTNDSKTSKLAFHYTLLDTENRSGANQGMELTDRAKHNASVNYSYHIKERGIILSSAIRYIGSQFTNATNTNQIDGYTIGDFGITKTFSNNDVRLRFSIDNVGDKSVLDTGSSELLEEGRSYNLTLSSNF